MSESVRCCDMRWFHQRRFIDDSARVKTGELRLRPAHHLSSWAIQKQLSGRVAPNDLIDDIVRPIGLISDAIAIEIEGWVVAPVIAPALLRPVQKTGAHIHDLGLV